MKIAIFYYSLDGHTKQVAQAIQEKLNADIIQLIPAEEPPKSGFMKYFWGGKSVFFNEKPELLNVIPDLESYTHVFIGTPVWSGTLTPPINTLLDLCSFEGKKVYLFASHKGSGGEKTFSMIQKRLPLAEIISSESFKESDVYHEKLDQWLQRNQIESLVSV